MVKHIILWTLKEEFSGEEKETIKQGIKEGLEGLSGQIPGLLEISVRTDCLPSSTVDRKSTRLNSSHRSQSRMPSSA